jgi:hypothetical protein
MMRGRMQQAVCVAMFAVMALPGSVLHAQDETIPQALARGATGSMRTEPSGQGPTINEVLLEADLIVRGTVGASASYLSVDQRDVYTDYVIANPTVIYQSGLSSSPQATGPPVITITQLGGTVQIGGLAYTQTEMGLLPLVPGMEGLFIATRRDGKYHVAKQFYGAFRIENGRLKPLTGKETFAPDFREVPVAQALTDLHSFIKRRR